MDKHGDKHKTGDAGQPSRRSFLQKLWAALGILVLVEFAAVAVAYFRPRARKQGGQENTVHEAGHADDFQPGTVTPFPNGKFYLVRLSTGGFLALSRTCTHLGCTVLWDEQKQEFLCPCHASAFEITGEVVRAPAPRSLDLYPVQMDHGVVKVNTSRAVRREKFDASQVVFLIDS